MDDLVRQTINTIRRGEIREKSIKVAKEVVKTWGERHGDPEATVSIEFWPRLVDRVEMHYFNKHPELRTVPASHLCYKYPYAEE